MVIDYKGKKTVFSDFPVFLGTIHLICAILLFFLHLPVLHKFG